MTASGDPAVCMRLEISGELDAESSDGLCECMFPRDIVEIAESIDEVRGIGRASARFRTLRAGDAVGRGDDRAEVSGGVACKDGDEALRS